VTGTTVFDTMSRLAAEHGAINLGQGAPGEGWPHDVVAVAARSLVEDDNQYAPMRGLPELRRAVAGHAGRTYGLRLDWEHEVLVTAGATEALAAAFLGLLRPGDEVVVLEPTYDSYVPVIERAGATAVPVRLSPPDFRLSAAALAQALSARTRLIVINNPQNPIGKVFSREELDLVADACVAHDLIAVCDEVYEHLVFDSCSHVPLITLPRMRDRCLRIGSAGKLFSLTGWKVGFVAGSPSLVGAVARSHQFLTYSVPPNLQRAVAYGLGKERSYFDEQAATLGAKRDRLARGLAAIGLDVMPCAGTYFLCVRGLPLAGHDTAVVERLVREARVATIPVSAFYLGRERPHGMLRLCFAKPDVELDEAVDRLGRYLTGDHDLSL
jgi:N-succinyldiaminopimelate aminotransferase